MRLFYSIFGLTLFISLYSIWFSALPPDFLMPPKWIDAVFESGQVVVSKISWDWKKESLGKYEHVNLTSFYLTGNHIVFQVFSGTQVANVIDGKVGSFFDSVGNPVFDDISASVKSEITQNSAYLASQWGKTCFVINDKATCGNYDGSRRIESINKWVFVTELVTESDPAKSWKTHIFINDREVGTDFDDVEWGTTRYSYISATGAYMEILYIAKKWGKEALVRETLDGEKRTMGGWFDEIHSYDIHIDQLRYEDYTYIARLGKKYYFMNNEQKSNPYDWLVSMQWTQSNPSWFMRRWKKEFIKIIGNTFWPYDHINTPITWDENGSPMFSAIKGKKNYLVIDGNEHILSK